MEQELFAFHAKFPEAIIDSAFMPETDAINLLLKDSLRMIIATRPLSAKEMEEIAKLDKAESLFFSHYNPEFVNFLINL